MTTDRFDALEAAKAELAEAMIPAPEDFVGDLGPLALVWYLNQVGWAVTRQYTALLAADVGEAPPDGSEPVQALNGLTLAMGMLDQTCVTLGLIDQEAAARP